MFAVLQAVSPQSKTHQLLLHGSRRASSLDFPEKKETTGSLISGARAVSAMELKSLADGAQANQKKVTTPRSEEILLKPNSLHVGWTNRSRTSRIKAFTLFSNKIAPVNDEDVEAG